MYSRRFINKYIQVYFIHQQQMYNNGADKMPTGEY